MIRRVILPRQSASCDCPSVTRGRSGGSRARSVPSARPYRVAALLAAVHMLCMVAALTAAVVLVIEPSELAMRIMLGGMAAGVATWILAYAKRRAVHCPLCKGTPLVSSGARPHLKAWRIPPLNHGTSATLSLLATQRFRCMYCGELFDLLKPSNRLQYRDEPQSQPTVRPPLR